MIFLRHIADKHALINIRKDLRSRIRGVHEVAAEPAIILIHKNSGVIRLPLRIHMRGGRRVGAGKTGDLPAQFAQPAEPEEIDGPEFALT